MYINFGLSIVDLKTDRTVKQCVSEDQSIMLTNRYNNETDTPEREIGSSDEGWDSYNWSGYNYNDWN